MLPKELTLTYLLKSRPSMKDLNEKCPNRDNFYKSIIDNWTKIKNKLLTTKEQIKNECIWLNNLISSKGKPLYSTSCLRNNMHYIKDLYTKDGIFKSLEQLKTDYNQNLNFLDILRIRQCIPLKWKQILSNDVKEDKTTEVQYNKMKRFNSLKCKTLYWLILPLNHDIISVPNSHKHWIEKYKLETLDKYFELPFISIRITFIQALQYKIINRVFNCNEWLTKIKIIKNAKCRFCNKMETIEHYFYECEKTLDFWNIFKTWWNSFKLCRKINITECDVILGSLEDSKFTQNFNCLILIAKGTVYSDKSNNRQPDFYNFLVQLKFYLKIEEQINIKNKTQTKFEIQWGDIANNI
jgi:hypothetical protein